MANTITISDPASAAIVAVSGAVEAVANAVRVSIEGQTPEQKKIMWDAYIENTKGINALIHGLNQLLGLST